MDIVNSVEAVTFAVGAGHAVVAALVGGHHWSVREELLGAYLTVGVLLSREAAVALARATAHDRLVPT